MASKGCELLFLAWLQETPTPRRHDRDDRRKSVRWVCWGWSCSNRYEVDMWVIMRSTEVGKHGLSERSNGKVGWKHRVSSSVCGLLVTSFFLQQAPAILSWVCVGYWPMLLFSIVFAFTHILSLYSVSCVWEQNPTQMSQTCKKRKKTQTPVVFKGDSFEAFSCAFPLFGGKKCFCLRSLFWLDGDFNSMWTFKTPCLSTCSSGLCSSLLWPPYLLPSKPLQVFLFIGFGGKLGMDDSRSGPITQPWAFRFLHVVRAPCWARIHRHAHCRTDRKVRMSNIANLKSSV